MHEINIFGQVRRAIAGLMKSIPEEQMFVIPKGFDNNLAWNFGHVVVVQESLIYRKSGVSTVTNDTHLAMFNMKTSPANWQANPDLGEIRTMLKETGKKLAADYEVGLFKNFEPYSTSTGFHVNSIEESISFVTFHEGLHLGMMLSILNFLKDSK